MSNATVNNDDGMMDALSDIVSKETFESLSETSRKIVLKLAERTKLAEKRIEGVKRNLWSVVCDMWKDDEADELVARLMKRAEKRKK